MITLIATTTFLLSCQGSSKKSNKLDLTSYGMPIAVDAPDGATIDKTDEGLMDRVIISGGKDYGLEITAMSALTQDMANIKQSELDIIKGNPYFSQIVKEDDTGFIYETVVDSTNIRYNFFKVKVQGDTEFRYILPTQFGGFSKEDAIKIYDGL